MSADAAVGSDVAVVGVGQWIARLSGTTWSWFGLGLEL